MRNAMFSDAGLVSRRYAQRHCLVRRCTLNLACANSVWKIFADVRDAFSRSSVGHEHLGKLPKPFTILSLHHFRSWAETG